jgi:hypothetical protein
MNIPRSHDVDDQFGTHRRTGGHQTPSFQKCTVDHPSHPDHEVDSTTINKES